MEGKRLKAASDTYNRAYEQGARDALINGYAFVYCKNDQGETIRVKIEKDGPFIRTTEAK